MIASTPAVSVILPVYERLALLRYAVESVFAQSVENWELIIADDGSSAAMRTWLASLSDPRVRVLHLAHSGVPSRVRNAALAVARGGHVAFLDSDDVWEPTHLERHLDAARKNPEHRWSYSACGRIDADGRQIQERSRPERMPRDGWIYEAVLARRIVMREVLRLAGAEGSDPSP